MRLPKAIAVAVLVLAVCLAARGSADAHCVEFQASGSGNAFLLNHCRIAINIAYTAVPDGAEINGLINVVRLTIPPNYRILLWTRAGAPFFGRYQIKIFGCSVPTEVVLRPGENPNCQIDASDAG